MNRSGANMAYRRRKVRLGQTAFGLGVFAQREFRAREVIGRVRGTVIRDPDYGSSYCMELGSGLILEPHPPFKFLNHCCEPNCELFVWDEDEGDPASVSRLWVQAVRTIEPGEELSIDYAWTADSAIPCQCNSPNCRGWIVDSQELDQLLRTAVGDLALPGSDQPPGASPRLEGQ